MNRRQFLFFLCGQLGLMTLVRFYFQWTTKFVDQPAGGGAVLLEPVLVGGAFFAARIFDAVTDPIAGRISDGWVARGHRRRTLLLFSFLLPVVTLPLLFAPSVQWSAGARWAVMLGAMFAFFVGYTAYCIPYWSLVDDYACTPSQVQSNSTALGSGILLSFAIVAVVSPALIGAVGYLSAAAIFAAGSAPLLVMPYFADPGFVRGRATGRSELSFVAGLRTALGDRSFAAVLSLFCGSQMALSMMSSGAPHIAEVLLGGSEKDVARLLGPMLAMAIPSSLLLRRAGLRWQRAVPRACLLLGIVYVGTAVLGQGIIGSAMTTAMLIFALAGPMVAVILGLEGEAIVECAKRQTGELTSVYFGVFNLMVKAGNGLAMWLVNALVSLSRRAGWRVLAIRCIGFTAGGLLALGAVGYVLLRRVMAPADLCSPKR